jgi:hypothetical protein
MSTRQLRLTSVDSIRKNLNRLSGKNITLVLTDNTVMFGKVLDVQSDGLVIVNGRLKKATFTLTDISEIYFDSIA